MSNPRFKISRCIMFDDSVTWGGQVDKIFMPKMYTREKGTNR